MAFAFKMYGVASAQYEPVCNEAHAQNEPRPSHLSFKQIKARFFQTESGNNGDLEMQKNPRVRVSVCMFLGLCSRRKHNLLSSKHEHQKATDLHTSISYRGDENPAWHDRFMLALQEQG
jgi:hypothetical protein